MFKAVDKWLWPYLARACRGRELPAGLRHLIFCLADHFEPFGGGADGAAARTIVRGWTQAYPPALEAFRDADGHPPQHTFFYPAEEYDPDCLNMLAGFRRRGLGEVEIQLHHRRDTAEGMATKLVRFRDCLHRTHGLLGSDADHQARYGFVHGNWALCNSRPDGDWCGVNEELGILRATGCYADFTFPSAPSPTQPRMVNSIYYARDIRGKPRGHDRGEESKVSGVRCQASAGGAEVGIGSERGGNGSLMLIQGPLALNWVRRKWGVLPRLENGAITAANPPTPERIELWGRQNIHVAGRPEWVFVKVYTHGCVPQNEAVLLGDAMRQAHVFLKERFNDGTQWQLHYVTAREMYNIIRAAEAGESGNPGRYRDYEIYAPQ